MRKIRVLVVDDSAAIRRLVTQILSSDPQIEVIASASDGRQALVKIEQLKPDVITLDVDMPEMNGLEVLQEIKRRGETLPVIMFSTHTEAGAQVTLDALTLGAQDYVAKPAGASSPMEAMERVREELLPKVRALAAKRLGIQMTPEQISLRKRTRASSRIDLICIGASTGGPNALAHLFGELASDLPVPIMVVQHMPPLFTKLLAERLAGRRSDLRVSEAKQGDLLEPGRIYIAPGNYHMMLVREGNGLKIQLNQGPQENSCRPSVDVLFRSVSSLMGSRTLALVMTGMGQDGLRGARELTEVGAQIVVQDEVSSVVWGMAGAVAKAGLAEKILPLDQLAQELHFRLAEGRSWRPGVGA